MAWPLPSARTMERIVLHTSPRSLYGKLAFGLLGMGIGAAILALDFPVHIGWGIMGLSGVYALTVLRSLGEETERVVIDDSGVSDSILTGGVIGWNEVQGASVQRIGSVTVVALQLRDPERFIRRLSPGRQFLARKALEAGLPGVYLTLVGTDGDPNRIAELINQRSSRVRAHRCYASDSLAATPRNLP
jgi:hypothetical protein